MVLWAAPLPLVTQVDKVRKSQPGNLCAKHLDKAYYKSLEGEDRDTFYKCVKTGIDNPDSGMGCYAMTPAGEHRAFELAATKPPLSPASIPCLLLSHHCPQPKWSRRPRCCCCDRFD